MRLRVERTPSKDDILSFVGRPAIIAFYAVVAAVTLSGWIAFAICKFG